MKVLVVGATGLIAQPVIKALKKEGHSLKLFSRKINSSALSKDYEVCQGDVLNKADLKAAIFGCDAIHISISKVDEALAVELIVAEAQKQGVKLISYVSGCTVCDENRWFTLIDSKFRAEKLLKESGIIFKIFKPGWFFESLSLMIRDNKATVIGKKLNKFHWLVGSDFGSLVANSYKKQNESVIEYALGPDKYSMQKLLTLYCKNKHENIKKVTVIPTGILLFIGKLFNKTELVNAAKLFRYFEQISEPDVKVNTAILKTNFESWLKTV